MSSDLGFQSSGGRDTAGIGNAWGTAGGSFIRRIFNAVIPVTVVERWFGELDGSLFGLTGGTGGALGFRPSVELVSEFRDWECHALNIWYPIMATVGATAGPTDYEIAVSVFTAIQGYDPIEFATVGPFGPQLVTNANFDQGTVRGFAGVNPVNNPNGFGWLVAENVTRVGVFGSAIADQVSDSWGREYAAVGGDRSLALDKKLANSIKFPRPLRMKRGRRLTVQLQGDDDTFSYTPLHSLIVSCLYSELPNPRASYLTP